jgi:predicted Zn finger-like uncharacterized protein
MIISCSCGAKLKINEEKLSAGGAKIRCPRCRTIHVVQRPAKDVHEAAAAAPARPAVPPVPEASMPWFAPAAAAVSAPTARGPLVLVAHDSRVVADMIDGVLKTAGIATEHASNGLDALKIAMELRPQAMIVDVGLTGIYGFELCERLKGDPATKGIRVILLSSAYGLTAYKRAPVNLYGADDYIEKHDIPDGLVPKLKALLPEFAGAGRETSAERLQPAVPSEPLGGGTTDASRADGGTSGGGSAVRFEKTGSDVGGPSSPVGRRVPVPDEAPSVIPKAPVTLGASRARPGSGPISSRIAERRPEPQIVTREDVRLQAPSAVPPPKTTETEGSVKMDAAFMEEETFHMPAPKAARAAVLPAEIEKARRFARLIVADIALYNQEAVVEGIRKGTFYDLLKDDITEGRSVYEQRIPESVRMTKDYLQEAFDEFLASKKKLR